MSRLQRWIGGLALTLGLATAAAVPAPGSEDHAGVPELVGDNKTHTAGAAKTPALPFPSKIGGDFTLVDQTGATRRLRDFAGRPLLIFFGYARCKAICTVALPRMGETVDLLSAVGIDVQPILITVDPERDTPEAMRTSLPRYHRRLIGLTGTREALNRAQKTFQVESKVVYVDPDGNKIFSHGSFIYLMGADGTFLTLMPPILGSERMAEIVRKYL